MKGSYHVRVSTRSLVYDFTIRRNITILQGDSATGKTTLVEMIREHETQGPDSAVTLMCSRSCTVIEGNTWQRQLRELFTWEQFFTALLVRETAGTFLRYKKTTLNPAYLNRREADAVKSVIPAPVIEMLDA